MSKPPSEDQLRALAGELCDMNWIADLAMVRDRTVRQWRYRRILPEPVLVISRWPMWLKSDIRRFLEETDRPMRKGWK